MSEHSAPCGCSMNRSYAQLPMNRPLPDFCAFKLQLPLLPLHKAPVRSPAPKAFITGFIRLKLHSPLSMVQAKGVEPLILSAAASKTAMYTNSNTPGCMSPLIFDYRRNGTLKPPNSVAFNAPLRQTGNEVIEHYIRLRVLRIFLSCGGSSWS